MIIGSTRRLGRKTNRAGDLEHSLVIGDEYFKRLTDDLRARDVNGVESPDSTWEQCGGVAHLFGQAAMSDVARPRILGKPVFADCPAGADLGRPLGQRRGAARMAGW